MTRRHLIYVWTLPADLLTWIVILALWAIWGTRLHWAELGPWFEWRAGSWPMRTWYKAWGGTCLGHGGLFRAGASPATHVHEYIHVEQYEVAMLVAAVSAAICAVCALAGGPLAAVLGGAACYLAGWLLKAAAGWLVAWLRGEQAYLGASHEEAAYAETCMIQRFGRDWLKDRQ